MDKNDRKKIKQLKKDGKQYEKEHKNDKEFSRNEFYDKIFYDYGRKIFAKNASKKYQKKEFKRLKKEGRYEDIYNKYGKAQYKKCLTKAYFDEIKYEKGLGSALLWRLRHSAKKAALTASIVGLSLATGVEAGTDSLVSNTYKADTEKYQEIIELYNDNIETYADEINALNLSDIQIFMKVMDDMWNSIKGYGTPEIDSLAYPELDLATEEGQGVCRNMASDVAKKLNEINPDYNARTMVAYMGESGGYQIADIDRTILEDNETVTDDEEKDETNESNGTIVKLWGNHMVTLVDIKSEGITLVLDPTNPGIGIYRNGTILMFNSTEENGLDFDSREISTIIMSRTGIQDLEAITDWLSSFVGGKLTLNEIKEKYGLEAQNQALMEVRALDIANSVLEEDEQETVTSSESSQEDSFEARIKVDVSKSNNSATVTNSNESQEQTITTTNSQTKEDDDELGK